MVKRTYTNVTKGYNEHYLAGWEAADRTSRHLPYDKKEDDGSQAFKDWMKGYYDRGRFWVLQQEAT